MAYLAFDIPSAAMSAISIYAPGGSILRGNALVSGIHWHGNWGVNGVLGYSSCFA